MGVLESTSVEGRGRRQDCIVGSASANPTGSSRELRQVSVPSSQEIIGPRLPLEEDGPWGKRFSSAETIFKEG